MVLYYIGPPLLQYYFGTKNVRRIDDNSCTFCECSGPFFSTLNSAHNIPGPRLLGVVLGNQHEFAHNIFISRFKSGPGVKMQERVVCDVHPKHDDFLCLERIAS